MNGASDNRKSDGVMPGDTAHAAAARAQIEQRLQHLFRFAGDGEAARQLRRMLIQYRWRQLQ